MLEMEPRRSLGEDWCRKQLNVVARKAQQTLSHKEAIKGTGESNGVRKTIVVLGFEELGSGIEERRLEGPS